MECPAHGDDAYEPHAISSVASLLLCHPGWARISSVSVAPSPPISTGWPASPRAMRAPPSSRSSLENVRPLARA